MELLAKADHGCLNPMIVNTTRYNTNDIAIMIKALWVCAESRNWVLTVKYALNLQDEPYIGGSSGPYVKFARNGDERTKQKVLAIAPPGKWKCDALVALSAVQSCEAPHDMLYEVARRVEMISTMHNSTQTPCTDRDAYSPYSEQSIKSRMEKYVEEGGIKHLRFGHKDPSAADLELNQKRVAAQQAYMLKMDEFNNEVSKANQFMHSAERNRTNAARDLEWAKHNDLQAAELTAKVRGELALQLESLRNAYLAIHVEKEQT